MPVMRGPGPSSSSRAAAVAALDPPGVRTTRYPLVASGGRIAPSRVSEMTLNASALRPPKVTRFVRPSQLPVTITWMPPVVVIGGPVNVDAHSPPPANRPPVTSGRGPLARGATGAPGGWLPRGAGVVPPAGEPDVADAAEGDGALAVA